MSTLLWLLGFGLMMASFTFLFGRSDEPQQPRISIDTRCPDADQPPR